MPGCFCHAYKFCILSPGAFIIKITFAGHDLTDFYFPTSFAEIHSNVHFNKILSPGQYAKPCSLLICSHQHGCVLVSFGVVSFALSEIQLYYFAVTLSAFFSSPSLPSLFLVWTTTY